MVTKRKTLKPLPKIDEMRLLSPLEIIHSDELHLDYEDPDPIKEPYKSKAKAHRKGPAQYVYVNGKVVGITYKKGDA